MEVCFTNLVVFYSFHTMVLGIMDRTNRAKVINHSETFIFSNWNACYCWILRGSTVVSHLILDNIHNFKAVFLAISLILVIPYLQIQ